MNSRALKRLLNCADCPTGERLRRYAIVTGMGEGVKSHHGITVTHEGFICGSRMIAIRQRPDAAGHLARCGLH